MIEELLTDLKETWDYTQEELLDIKSKMINLACAVLMDSKVRKEVDKAAAELADE